MIRLITIFILVVVSPLSHSIVYLQSDSKGKINEISVENFDLCKTIIYRKSAKKELSLKHKKALLKALIFGSAINSSDVLTSKLKANPGFCSYRADNEKID